MMGERTHTMSYLRTNFDSLLKSNSREYKDSEVETMTEKEFDELPLCDQISIFHNHRAEYDRLTGHTAPDAVGKRTVTEKAIDEYEKLVDDAITRDFHPNGA